jgi:hypothetical protein
VLLLSETVCKLSLQAIHWDIYRTQQTNIGHSIFVTYRFSWYQIDSYPVPFCAFLAPGRSNRPMKHFLECSTVQLSSSMLNSLPKMWKSNTMSSGVAPGISRHGKSRTLTVWASGGCTPKSLFSFGLFCMKVLCNRVLLLLMPNHACYEVYLYIPYCNSLY